MELKVFENTTKLFCQSIIYRIVKPAFERLEDGGLTEVQVSCLRYVSLHPEPSVGEIANGLAISNAASAKLIDRLVKKKLLTREEDQKDRRVLKINLTDKGKELLQEIRKFEVEMFQNILQRMTETEKEALEVGLTGFLKAALETPEQIDEICLRCGWEHIINCPGNLQYRSLTGKDKGQT